jgi:chitin synthase
MVFDLTSLVTNDDGGIVLAPNGTRPPDDVETKFMHEDIVELFKSSSGDDVTGQFEKLNLDPGVRAAQEVCLRNVFYIGKVDTRGSPQCLFSRYILLALSIFIVCIIGFKLVELPPNALLTLGHRFLAALSFGTTKKAPLDAEKFVIMQLPCYTEGEDSLRKSIESLAATRCVGFAYPCLINIPRKIRRQAQAAVCHLRRQHYRSW